MQKKNEFANLIQGQLSVSEYEARFIKLSEFAPEMVPTNTARVQRFEMGLWPMIRFGVRSQRLRILREVGHVARIVEADVLAMQQEYVTQGLHVLGPEFLG